MSKKYKGKTCVYCAQEPSTTADHVVAREFFLKQHRDNLPKVPACGECNSEKSRLEHYLTTILPFGGQHPDAQHNLQTMIPKRIHRNMKLREEVLQSMQSSRGTSIQIDPEKFESLFIYIAKGLAWYHWEILLNSDCTARVATISDAGIPLVNSLFDMKASNHIEMNLCQTFFYEGMQANAPLELTLWKMSMYNASFVSPIKGADGNQFGSQVIVLTGPSKYIQSRLPQIFKS